MKCARCGRRRVESQLQMVVSYNGKKLVPVCRDDRECFRFEQKLDQNISRFGRHDARAVCAGNRG